jgi:hypothetical protein
VQGGVHGTQQGAVPPHALTAIQRHVVDPKNVGARALMQQAACVDDRPHVLRGVLIAAAEGAGQRVDDDQNDGLASLLLDLTGDLDDASGGSGITEIVDAADDGEGHIVHAHVLDENRLTVAGLAVERAGLAEAEKAMNEPFLGVAKHQTA